MRMSTIGPVILLFHMLTRGSIVRHLRTSGLNIVLLAIFIGCRESPVSQGSYYRLSATTDQVLVVGNRPSAVSATVNWLQGRGVTALEMPGTWPIPTKQEITDMAHRLSVPTIVWVEQTGDLRAPTVSVRGIEADSHVVLWSGQASATKYRSSPTGARIIRLTCHALHAAWGEKPDGDRCE